MPGLPTTPFLLLATWFYLRSSRRLYNWVLKSKLFGPFIENFRTKKGLPIKIKVYSISIMWGIILISCIFWVPFGIFTIVLILLALVGTWVKLFIIPTSKSSEKEEEDNPVIIRNENDLEGPN